MKKIITAAITGAVHTPGMSPYLPITPDEIVNDAVGAAKAGAAVVHIHARNPENGEPTSDLSIMREIVTAIKKQSDVIVCITTGGQIGMSIEERIAAVPDMKPELASCNAGSLNFVLTPALKRLKPKYEWEEKFLSGTQDLIFSNTFKGLSQYVETMYANGTMPEFEVYDVGMINNIAYMMREGVIKAPVYIQFVMGILGGLPATVRNLNFLVETADMLLGDTFKWSVAAAGKDQFALTTAALAMGGHVRVGLEDNLYLEKGVLAKHSSEQVERIRKALEVLGHEVATPEEARQILSLKGNHAVNF
ncbi:3-keto-5-aminohexanoate cleavage protein [Fusibacter paucivorans]|uniref:3-keto-5-aminohexanoate cleavage protein n=1 Tax=Fusibacter paucivorans TaxID=76009 RepID=A0ABS5PQR4_9FIRM|nr:3-keto-5-aminohexanoate cleavage protein [Fusibacter paucivorans]MBS7527411.1 3-keto-5-aminohexanoate cleavage protein [Fusibacter paucivorans]